MRARGTEAGPTSTNFCRVRYFSQVYYYLGGLAIGLVLLVVLIMVGVKGMRGRD